VVRRTVTKSPPNRQFVRACLHGGNHVSPVCPLLDTSHDPAQRGLRSGKARLRPRSLLSFKLLAQGLRLDEVHESLPPVDFDDGYQLAVTSLELGIPVDLDFFELEAKFRA
jgi:hypothetical protein